MERSSSQSALANSHSMAGRLHALRRDIKKKMIQKVLPYPFAGRNMLFATDLLNRSLSMKVNVKCDGRFSITIKSNENQPATDTSGSKAGASGGKAGEKKSPPVARTEGYEGLVRAGPLPADTQKKSYDTATAEFSLETMVTYVMRGDIYVSVKPVTNIEFSCLIGPFFRPRYVQLDRVKNLPANHPLQNRSMPCIFYDPLPEDRVYQAASEAKKKRLPGVQSLPCFPPLVDFQKAIGPRKILKLRLENKGPGEEQPCVDPFRPTPFVRGSTLTSPELPPCARSTQGHHSGKRKDKSRYVQVAPFTNESKGGHSLLGKMDVQDFSVNDRLQFTRQQQRESTTSNAEELDGIETSSPRYWKPKRKFKPNAVNNLVFENSLEATQIMAYDQRPAPMVSPKGPPKPATTKDDWSNYYAMRAKKFLKKVERLD